VLLVNNAIYLKKIFSMYKVLGIGNALVDVMTVLPDESVLEKFGLPKGSMQLVDKSKSEQIKMYTTGFNTSLASGGSAANTIHGLAMFGTETGYIGSIGKDDLGNFFEKDMKDAGTSTILSRRDSPTGTAVALISPDSERTFATHLGAAVELIADDLNPSDFDGYDILYLEGYLIYNMPLVEAACRYASQRNIKVALDLASYNVVESHLPEFRVIIDKYVDIIFANEEEARAFTGMDPKEALLALSGKCEIAVIKAGGEGSWIKRSHEIIKIGTGKVDVIDTTGAGDLYAAGFLHGYASGKDLEICGQYGTIAAGKVIEALGAKIDDAGWNEIRRSISRLTPA
jgi:sugar/nucleoside kinase (ribokinase family)